MDVDRLLGAESLPEGEEEAALEAMLASQGGQARAQHYLFAHRLLPQATFSYGVGNAFLLGEEEKGQERLLALWASAGDGLPPEDTVEPDGLGTFTRREGDWLVTLVILPEPKNVTEAHFAAMVFGPLPERPEEDGEAALDAYETAFMAAPAHFYTLEYGVQVSARQHRTVFGAWTPEGAHLNFGTGPKADADIFVAFILSRLNGARAESS